MSTELTQLENVMATRASCVLPIKDALSSKFFNICEINRVFFPCVISDFDPVLANPVKHRGLTAADKKASFLDSGYLNPIPRNDFNAHMYVEKTQKEWLANLLLLKNTTVFQPIFYAHTCNVRGLIILKLSCD